MLVQESSEAVSTMFDTPKVYELQAQICTLCIYVLLLTEASSYYISSHRIAELVTSRKQCCLLYNSNASNVPHDISLKEQQEDEGFQWARQWYPVAVMRDLEARDPRQPYPVKVREAE